MQPNPRHVAIRPAHVRRGEIAGRARFKWRGRVDIAVSGAEPVLIRKGAADQDGPPLEQTPQRDFVIAGENVDHAGRRQGGQRRGRGDAQFPPRVFAEKGAGQRRRFVPFGRGEPGRDSPDDAVSIGGEIDECDPRFAGERREPPPRQQQLAASNDDPPGAAFLSEQAQKRRVIAAERFPVANHQIAAVKGDDEIERHLVSSVAQRLFG